MDALKKLKGQVSEDQVKRFSKDIAHLSEKRIDKITKLQKEKEKEISGDD